MNIIFYIIGACILAAAVNTTFSAQSAIHQIYAQLQYITAIFLIGFGHLFTCINKKEKTKSQKEKEKQ